MPTGNPRPVIPLPLPAFSILSEKKASPTLDYF